MRVRLLLGMTLLASAAWAATPQEELIALRARLAETRQLGRTAGWTAELGFAAAHKKDAPDLAAEVIYDVALSQMQQDRSSVAKTLETLLETHPKAQPWAALAAYELAAAYGDRSSTQAKAIELYRQFLDSKLADPVRRASALMGLARLCQGAAKPDEAMAAYRAFLAEFPDRVEPCAEALAGVGLALVEQKKLKGAYDVYLKLSADCPWALEARRGLLLAVAQASRTAEDREGAIAAYEKLLEALPSSDSRRSQVYMGLAMLYLQQNDSGKAVATYRRMAADTAMGASYRASAFRQLFDIRRRANEHAGIVRLACELIAAQPSAVLASGNVLGELVGALVDEGRIEEAIAMARAYWRLSYLATAASSYGSSVSQEAIFAIVRALKASEGSLRAANRFIAFVEHGAEGPDGAPGTADDIEDPTAPHRLPADPERDKLFAAAAQRFITDPYELGHLYLCWDKPEEALLAFRRYYLDAAGEATKLQRAAAVLAQAMRAVGCPESEVETFFDFQNYGPNGKDGKPKTKDDLQDPILKRKK